MFFRRDDHYSPNHVLLITAITLVCAAVLCAHSLWIPASRIGNLHVRAVVLSVTDAISAYAAETGLDTLVPRARSEFLESSGLSRHSSWDSRYFNRREPVRRTASDEPARQDSVSSSTETTLPADRVPPDERATVTATAAVSGKAVSGSDTGRIPSSTVYSRDNPLPVYFFGDSQVFSLASGLSRLAGKNSAIDIEFLAIHSSGFIRDDFYDWPKKLEDTLGGKDYPAVVVMLGMNDYQNFWADNRRALKKRTEAWETVYREKCRAIIDCALSRAMRVYWVGMPLVKNATYNDNLTYIEHIHDTVAEEYSPDVLTRISLKDIFPGDDNAYAESVELSPGKVIQVMTDDGSHYTVEGGQVVMAALFDRLVRDFPFSELPVAQLPQ